MPNPNYRRGNYGERRAADILRELGYVVWQARGSKGTADLLAIKARGVVIAQVKWGAPRPSHAGWNSLYELSLLIDATPLWIDRVERLTHAGTYDVRMRRIIGWHEKRSTVWPNESWPINERENGAVVPN